MDGVDAYIVKVGLMYLKLRYIWLRAIVCLLVKGRFSAKCAACGEEMRHRSETIILMGFLPSSLYRHDCAFLQQEIGVLGPTTSHGLSLRNKRACTFNRRNVQTNTCIKGFNLGT